MIRAIAKVADSYKKEKKIKHVFKSSGAFAYDARILTYHPWEQTVSIWTAAGRLTIPYVMGASQKELFKYQKGESDLRMVKGKFYLNAACDIPEEKVMEISDMIGVDLGIRQLATTSEEKYYTGEKIEQNRRWYAGRRAALQKVGTKSAKRRLKKLSGKERKFKKDTNHIISKEIVADAKRTHCGIAMEDLKGIRKGKGKKVRKKQRATFSGRSFYELRQFITC
ncbi:MAG TPA: transposase, partial [Chitinophagaceae bacterium]|nr:transposase [Chitinophagaceae bacterium]